MCVCVLVLCLSQNVLPLLPTTFLCLVLAIPLMRYLYTCACMCVPIYVRAWKCVMKVININKYNHNRDDVTCNIKIDTQIDVHSDVKQAVKWQLFRHLTEYDMNKYNTINASVFWTLRWSWIVVPSLPSWLLSPLSFDGPQLWRSVSVCSSLQLLTSARCARCSHSIPLWLASHLLAPAGGRWSEDCFYYCS